MPYLIDGHNLIPHLPDLDLAMPDDEIALVERLQSFSAQTRKKVEVYFDKAPAGMAQTRKFGRVTAIFIRQGGTADRAISARLRELGRTARNWTVVSSDGWVQSQARAAGASVRSAAEFAAQLETSRKGEGTGSGERAMTDAEVEEWLRLFGGGSET